MTYLFSITFSDFYALIFALHSTSLSLLPSLGFFLKISCGMFVIQMSAFVKNSIFCPVKVSFISPSTSVGWICIMQSQFEFELWASTFVTRESCLLMWNLSKCSWNIFLPWLRVFGLMMVVCNLNPLLSLGNFFRLVSNFLTLNVVGFVLGLLVTLKHFFRA